LSATKASKNARPLRGWSNTIVHATSTCRIDSSQAQPQSRTAPPVALSRNQQVGRSAHRDQHRGQARRCHGPDHGNAEQHVTAHEQDRCHPLMITTRRTISSRAPRCPRHAPRLSDGRTARALATLTVT
jgi:hypothetical protein